MADKQACVRGAYGIKRLLAYISSDEIVTAARFNTTYLREPMYCIFVQ